MGLSVKCGSGYALGGTGGGPPGTNTNDSVLLFGAGLLGSSTTLRYLYPGYDDSLAQTVAVQMVAPYAGNLRFLYVYHNKVQVPPPPGVLITYTVRVNGVATLLSTTLGSDVAGPASDVLNSVPVVAGDRIDIEVSKSGSVAPGLEDITATLDLKVA